MIANTYSPKDFQRLNQELYLIANDRSYSSSDLLSCLHRHVTCILKAVRKEKYADITWHLCMSFSWSLGLVNRFHFDLAEKMWELFPGYCPYCSQAPCICKERSKERSTLKTSCSDNKPFSLREWQSMFAKIYINGICDQAIHLAEETGEVSEAIRNYSATHKKEWLNRVIEELVDLITNIFGVANCLNIDLMNSITEYFSKGCPKCLQLPCDCEYITIDLPVPSSKGE